MLCFLKSDVKTYPEIRYKFFDNDFVQYASLTVRVGDNSVNIGGTNGEHWGDYTGIHKQFNASVPTVWLSGSYGNSDSRWNTFLAKISGTTTVLASQINLLKQSVEIFPDPVTT